MITEVSRQLYVKIKDKNKTVKTCGAFIVGENGGDLKTGYCLILQASCRQLDTHTLDGEAVSFTSKQIPAKNLTTCEIAQAYQKGAADRNRDLVAILDKDN